MKKTQGFTLIETLVVILIMGLIGFLLSELLWRTFRGGNKTRLIGNIKQNGQAALNVIDQTIRSSDAVVCLGTISAPNAAISIIRNGKYTVFWFDYPSNQNGRILKAETDTDPKDPSTGFCNTTSGLSRVGLTDEDPYQGVSVITNSGSFTKASLPGFKDVVTINLELGPGVLARSTAGSQTSTVVFNTTVELR